MVLLERVFGSAEETGAWKADFDDKFAQKRLVKVQDMLKEVRGEPYVRVMATYDINPLTQRIDRGFVVTLNAYKAMASGQSMTGELEEMAQEGTLNAGVLDDKSGSKKQLTYRGRTFGGVWMHVRDVVWALLLGAIVQSRAVIQAVFLCVVAAIDLVFVLMFKPSATKREMVLRVNTVRQGQGGRFSV